jgi:hypothetical protein
VTLQKLQTRPQRLHVQLRRVFSLRRR